MTTSKTISSLETSNCRPCQILGHILREAEHKHRAFESALYDVMDAVLHEEIAEDAD